MQSWWCGGQILQLNQAAHVVGQILKPDAAYQCPVHVVALRTQNMLHTNADL